MAIKVRWICAWVLGALVFGSTVLHAQQKDAALRASVVKLDITPETSQNLLGYGPRMSTGVHDRIFHKIIALDDGSNQFYLISTDICLISPAEYDRLAARIQKEHGIDPMRRSTGPSGFRPSEALPSTSIARRLMFACEKPHPTPSLAGAKRVRANAMPSTSCCSIACV